MVITDQRHRDVIARYVARSQGKLPSYGDNFVAIGSVNGAQEIMAGAVFTGYEHPNILMHIAADAMTPQFVAAIMRYPFVQLGCLRVTGLIEKRNHASRRFAKHLGAVLEGTMKDASLNGDVCVYGLLRASAEKWLGERYQQRLEPMRKAA